MGRKGKMITYEGVTDSILGWARRIGVSDVTIQRRLNMGDTVEEAMKYAQDLVAKRTSNIDAKLNVKQLVEAPQVYTTPIIIKQYAHADIEIPPEIMQQISKAIDKTLHVTTISMMVKSGLIKIEPPNLDLLKDLDKYCKKPNP